MSIDRARLGGASVVMLFRDAEATLSQPSRFGLIGRLAGEPGSRPVDEVRAGRRSMTDHLNFPGPPSVPQVFLISLLGMG